MNELQVYAFDGVVPVVHPDAYVHPSAVLIGDVVIGPNCYIGPCACLRGDFGRIEVRAGANVQDTCVLHSKPGTTLVIEEDGHIGHGAVIHGCRIGRNVLVGMNAVVMDNADIGESSIIAASAFVPARTIVPPYSLVAGVPAKVLRTLADADLVWKRMATATYQELARRSKTAITRVAPLSAEEPDRKRIAWPTRAAAEAAQAAGEKS